MSASNRTGGSDLKTHDDLELLKEGHEVERHHRQGTHDLRFKIVRDWIILGAVTSALVASFLGMIGVMSWPGPVTPTHVFFSIVSGWVGTRLPPSRKR